MTALTTHRDLDLELDVAPRPLWLDADPVALERVVTNLLSNAVKFTPDGGRIGLAAHLDPDDAGAVRLVVSDSGIGIPQADLDRGDVSENTRPSSIDMM